MQSGRSGIEYVLDSGVRTELLVAIARNEPSTATLLEETDASQSAVYSALGDLEGRDLVDSVDERWRVTGRGRIVADLIGTIDRIEDVFAADDRYWNNHDAGAIPREFRIRLAALSECRIERATETDPGRVKRLIGDRLDAAEEVWIATPIYDPGFAEKLAGVERARLLFDEAVVTDLDKRPSDGAMEGVTVRIGSVEFALTVTDECLLASLPECDGGYDARTEIVAEDERALDWATELFEHCWSESVPVEEFFTGR